MVKEEKLDKMIEVVKVDGDHFTYLWKSTQIDLMKFLKSSVLQRKWQRQLGKVEMEAVYQSLKYKNSSLKEMRKILDLEEIRINS